MLAAAALTFTGAASASGAKVLELSTVEGPLAAGTRVSIGGSGGFETPDGPVECSTAVITAKLLGNDAAADRVTIEGGAPDGPHGVRCTSTLGTIEVQAGDLPWTQQFAATGRGLLKGHGKLRFTVTVPSLLDLQCSYEDKRISETFPLAAEGVATPLQPSVSDQSFTRSAPSPGVCPASIEADFAGAAVSVPGPSGEPLAVYVTRRTSARG